MGTSSNKQNYENHLTDIETNMRNFMNELCKILRALFLFTVHSKQA